MEPKGFHRKLTTIFTVEVVYRRLKDNNKTGSVNTIKSHRNLIAEKIQASKVRVVDSPGDNILTEFRSILDAVACTVGIQNELKEKNPDLRQTPSIRPPLPSINPKTG